MEQNRKKCILWNRKRRILYTLCFVIFCLIDQRTKTTSGLDGLTEVFRDLTGVVMAVIMMSHYRLSEFKKWKKPYIAWSVIWIIGLVPVFWWGKFNYLFFHHWCVLVLNVILYGYITIHTFISVVLEKKMPKLNRLFAIIWLVMMILMVVSRSTYLWPLAYLIMFGCFYLTDFTKEEQEDLFQGILDGIILAFFLAQGWCLVFRPYDLVRYIGIYSNPNINALFYLEVLAAVFTKIFMVTRNQGNKWIRIYYWLGAGVSLSFLFMTIGRTAWLTAFLMGLVFLMSLKWLRKKPNFLKNGLILVLCTCITFPICFGAVRYFPPLFHHPVWHWGEWNERKVHSWDPWDSEKYIDMDEFLDAALGRIIKGAQDVLENSPFALKAHAAEVETDPRVEIAVLTHEQARDAILVRKTIYQHYFRNLNLWGHPYEEQGFQLHPTYWIGHAHNIYLQYGTDFGIIVMILFTVMIVWPCVVLFRRLKKKCTETELGYWMFLMVPALFGLFEYSWGAGSITILLLFVTWRNVICMEETEKM